MVEVIDDDDAWVKPRLQLLHHAWIGEYNHYISFISAPAANDFSGDNTIQAYQQEEGDRLMCG
jgi:hypothetical protein